MHEKPTSFIVLLAVLTIASTLPVCLAAETGDGPTDSPAAVCRELGRGINLGNALESPHEGDWGVTLREDYFTAIQQAGFSTIRVPICWSAHVLPEPPYTIDPAFAQRVDWVVAQAKAHHLNAILDYHNDNKLIQDPSGNEERYLATWRQIAERYQTEPPTILFELLNEPNGKLDADTWNKLLVRALAVVRPTNPNRLVVIGPIGWNGIWALPKLVLPDTDTHLVTTVHFYDPMKFTHQGASWIDGSTPWLGTTWQGTDAEKQTVDHSMDQAAAWGQAHHRPMFLGEFGAFEKGDMASRQRWIQCVARSAETHDLAWAYWEFCAGFGAYDPVKNEWRAPLLSALMLEANATPANPPSPAAK